MGLLGLVCSVGTGRMNHNSLRAVVTLWAARLRRLFKTLCVLSNRFGDSRPAPYCQIQKTHREGGFFVSGSKGRIRTADPNIMSVVL